MSFRGRHRVLGTRKSSDDMMSTPIESESKEAVRVHDRSARYAEFGPPPTGCPSQETASAIVREVPGRAPRKPLGYLQEAKFVVRQ